jgi:hypothetical protein
MADQPLFMEVEPGIYAVDPDGEPDTTLRVVFTIAAPGWRAWVGTYKHEATDEAGSVGLSVAAVSEIVVDPCNDHRWEDPGPTVDDLASALAGLSSFDLTAPVTSVDTYGYSGKTLELRVSDVEHDGVGFVDCSGGYLYSWRSATERNRTLDKYYQVPGQVLELWILDVDGSRLVIEASKFPNASPGDVAELEAILDSIRIEP